MSEISILIISNGHGEDLMGGFLAKTLRELHPPALIRAFPVVGVGKYYSHLNIPIVGIQRKVPSEGLTMRSVKVFWRDIMHGLISLSLRQFSSLLQLQNTVDLAIVIGDSYALFMACRYVRKPIIFIPTAKSDYIGGHSSVEIKQMKRHCAFVYPRDSLTADKLCKAGVPAQYMGNLMMDSLDITEKDFGLPGGKVIGILPGSRDESYVNIVHLAAAALCLQEKLSSVRFLVAIAPNLSMKRFIQSMRKEGWRFTPSHPQEIERGITAEFQKRNCVLYFVEGRFGDVLSQSKVCLGMAGTANEQAVGLGKPVISFAGDGPGFNDVFLQKQKNLLGEALITVKKSPDEMATAAEKILLDSSLYSKLAAAGQERMGGRGAAQRIAESILQLAKDMRLLHEGREFSSRSFKENSFKTNSDS